MDTLRSIIKEMVELGGKLCNFTSLSTSVAPGDPGGTLIASKLAERMRVSLELFRTDGNSAGELETTYANDVHEGGTYIVSLGDRVKPGAYLVRLKAGTTLIEQPLEIR